MADVQRWFSTTHGALILCGSAISKADSNTTACAPFLERCGVGWRAARQQETVQVELIEASFNSLRSGRPARANSER
jgi:hypothetical protein